MIGPSIIRKLLQEEVRRSKAEEGVGAREAMVGIMPFEDGGRGKESGWPLEAEKDKEVYSVYSLMKPLEGTQP